MTQRLDAALAERGLARSRSHAATLIAAGLVTVDGQPTVKPAARVSDDTSLVVAGADDYVSRGAHKLIAALDAFGIDAQSRFAVDLGASTGGFTQVLLERGAERVVAIDVGHDQLDAELARDPRVRSAEGINVRYLTTEALAELAGDERKPGIVTGDLSFISLTLILPMIASITADDADTVLLVKPQFEVGRTGIKEGVVRDPIKRRDALIDVLWAAWDEGLGTFGVIASPIAGSHGNREFLVWFRHAPTTDASANPSEWMSTVDEVARTDD